MECDYSSMGWGLGVWRGGSCEVGAVMSGNLVKVQELYSSHCICRPQTFTLTSWCVEGWSWCSDVVGTGESAGVILQSLHLLTTHCCRHLQY